MSVGAFRSMVRSLRRRWRDEPYLRAAATRADAFLVSYPKSGRTWLRYLLSCYLAEVDELGFEPDLVTTFRVLPNFDRDPVRGVGAFVGGTPLVLVSHLAYTPRLFGGRPILFLVRDPRDVIVSAYFHATRHKGVFTGDMDAFLDDPAYGLPSLLSFLNGWAAILSKRRHLVVSYEHMMSEPRTAVTAILAFLGLEVRPDALDRAISLARFDRMRDRERVQGIPGHQYDRSDDQSLRMRSGRAKAFTEVLSPAQADTILDRCRTGLNPAARELLRAADIDFAVPGTPAERAVVAA